MKEVTENDSNEKVTENDVIAYLGLKLDDDDKWRRVVELAKTEGSWVQKMIAEIEKKCTDPFGGIDRESVAISSTEDKDESLAREAAIGESLVHGPDDGTPGEVRGSCAGTQEERSDDGRR